MYCISARGRRRVNSSKKRPNVKKHIQMKTVDVPNDNARNIFFKKHESSVKGVI